jgi:hypothetical protein
MVQSGINTIEDIEDKVDKTISQIKGIPEEARIRLKKVGLDVAEILLKRGVPVTAGTLAGIMATAMTGQPAAGIAASVIAGYATQMAVNKLAKEEDINGSSGSGLYSGGQIASGLYAGSQQGRGFDSSDSEDECVCSHCGMSGGKLLVDRKFSVRDVYNAAKSVPKVYKENVKSLKEGKQEGGLLRMPPQPKVIENGIVRPMSGRGGRGAKGSQQAKDFMAKLRAMRKKK